MNKGTKRLVGVSLAVTLAFSVAVFAKTLLFSPRKGIAVKTGNSGYKEWEEKPVKAEPVQNIKAAEPKAEPKPEPEKSEDDNKININTADASVLEQLPGIGEYLAETIVSYRQENGSFEKTEDIMKVSGIGPAKYKGIADFISVGAR